MSLRHLKPLAAVVAVGGPAFVYYRYRVNQEQFDIPVRVKNADGKSLTNLEPTVRSRAYEEFVEPITKNNNGFDFHSEYTGEGGGVSRGGEVGSKATNAPPSLLHAIRARPTPVRARATRADTSRVPRVAHLHVLGEACW